jgi:hypothetical protein
MAMGISNRLERLVRVRRGNVLVLSTLILLTLSSVGLLSVQQAQTDLLVAGNLGRAVQGKMIAEAGLTHALVVAGAGLDKHMRDITLNRRLAAHDAYEKKGGPLARYSTADLNPLSYADETDPIPILDPGGPYSLIARRNQQMAYKVESLNLGESQGSEGYGVNANFCFQNFDLEAFAGMPSRLSQNLDTSLNPKLAESVIVQYRARTKTGPSHCEKRTGVQ